MVTGVILLLGAALLVAVTGFGWLWRLRLADRDRIALLAASLGTISGVCYHYQNGSAARVDGHSIDPLWPLRLDVLLDGASPADKISIESDLGGLAREGRGFFREIRLDARMIEISGHRVTAAKGSHSLNLIWLTDVTERMAAARDRADTEREVEMWRDRLDRLPIPVWWLDQPDSPCAGNRQFQDMPGLAAEAAALAAEAAKTGSIQRRRAVLSNKSEAQPLILVALPVGNGILGFTRDRSEVEAVQAELDRLTLGHREVLEAIGAGIAIYGPDARLLFNNRAFEHLWALEHDWLATAPSLIEVLDRLRDMRALPEYADFRRFKIEQAALFEQLKETREELLHLPDERTLRLRISRHPFGGLTFTYEDVTDKLALERSYNTLIDVQRETLDNLFEGVAVFGSDGRLKLSNPAYGKLWRLLPVDLANRPHIASLVEKSRPFYWDEGNWEQLRASIIDKVTAYTASGGRLERRDGSILEISTVPLPDGNVLLSYLDVTDSERVQRALWEKNEALETAGRLKSEFIANVSYELRTPLNAIIGFAEILNNQYFGPLNERQGDYSRGILDSSHRLLSLINDILDLATIEAGQFSLDLAPVDIHSLLAGILALSRERARRLELTLGFDCPTDIGSILVDESRIKQALFNLMSNAIKFTPPGGTVLLGAKRDGEGVAILVADTGIGIPQEYHSKIFEKFERGAPAGRQAGAGLGLSLVKSYIELHGGHIMLDSQPTQGTKVTCWLPTDPNAGKAVSPAPPLTSNIRNATPLRDGRADESHVPPALLRQNPSESA